MEDGKNANSTESEVRTTPDEFVSLYANNVRFESSGWDLRIIFGHFLANSEGNRQVDWHTDVTIPWAQAKLMQLYLGVNLAVYESENGRISIPASALPAAITAPPAGVDTSNPEAIATFERVRDLINGFREAELPSK